MRDPEACVVRNILTILWIPRLSRGMTLDRYVNCLYQGEWDDLGDYFIGYCFAFGF